MNIQTYLERINYRGSLKLTPHTLRELQLAHLYTVPFENLSIHSGEAIVLADEALYAKIVTHRRGGFCYELNGLFAALLRALGFKVTMLSAAVARDETSYGPAFDHMTLMVELEERWLVDVGFGDSFLEPLRLDSPQEQAPGKGDNRRAYRVQADGAYWRLSQRDYDGIWSPQFRFTQKPYQYADYAAMCYYHQTSPESHFTQRRVCSRATPEGRITLSGMRLITTQNGERQEQELANEAAYTEALWTHFGIVLGC
ncbi:MAG: arylamine N-acetyltransferase [Anaerolineae bacterium]|nr:arylamine N-acetyltransferase [Anaerolineae bacterium]